MNDPRHKQLNIELEKDIEGYTRGFQRSFPISPKLAASVATWPIADKEIIVYRGQPKEFNMLPMPTKSMTLPFFSTTTRLDIAQTFAKYAPKGGQVFVIKIQPGVRFLVISGSGEGEILVAANGIAEYGSSKVQVKQPEAKGSATPVIYKPQPTGGRRKTRRRTKLRGSSRAGRTCR